MGLITLFDHWKDSLQSCDSVHGRPRMLSKIYRFLLGCYEDDARWIEYPRRPFVDPEPTLLSVVQPRPPRSPEQIRRLLQNVAHAVAAASEATPIG